MTEVIPVQVDPDLVDIIPGYLANRRLDMQRMREAVTLQDFSLIGHIGHKMKGTGQGYGFVVLTELGISLEIAAEERDIDSVRHILVTMEDYLARVQPQSRKA